MPGYLGSCFGRVCNGHWHSPEEEAQLDSEGMSCWERVFACEMSVKGLLSTGHLWSQAFLELSAHVYLQNYRREIYVLTLNQLVMSVPVYAFTCFYASRR